ncbi:MAG: hypothetical protein QXS76_00135 [Candidatus Bathyarchaeia archaeon]
MRREANGHMLIFYDETPILFSELNGLEEALRELGQPQAFFGRNVKAHLPLAPFASDAGDE